MLEGDQSYQRRQEKTLPNNEPSSGQRGKTLSRFKKWLREKYPRVYGFFFSKTPFYIRHFFGLLVSLGILGGFLALTVPLWKSWNSIPFLGVLIPTASTDYSEPKAIADLRLHILYITGGIIAILTLLQTNWKNQGDRLKIDADIKKNEQDAEKNERDHIRQVHAERRSRYTKAIEQLANEKAAAIRLGGAYTLVGLVDEWIADDTLKPEEQQKEGQVIINNLCAYIRSPFPLLEKKDKNDTEKSQIYEEQKIRQSILKEFSSRIKYIPTANNLSINNLWQKLTYDFSDSKFFYEVDFSNTYFKGKTSFSNTTFTEDAVFNESFFMCPAQFNGSKFTKNLNFNKSTFIDDADFSKVDFDEYINFSEVTFNMHADFRDSAFHNRDKEADFSRTNFNGIADFAVARFKGKATFRNSIFNKDAFFNNTEFNGTNFIGADFSKSLFLQDANFNEASFNKYADFNKAIFIGKLVFCAAVFSRWSHFSNSIFLEEVDFSMTTFSSELKFDNIHVSNAMDFTMTDFMGSVNFSNAFFKKKSPTFLSNRDEKDRENDKARFSCNINPEKYIFDVHPRSPHNIHLGTATFYDKKYRIPLGTVLYEPEARSQPRYVSEPAKLVDNSRDGERDIPE